MEAKANARDNQPEEEEAEHGYPGIQRQDSPVTA